MSNGEQFAEQFTTAADSIKHQGPNKLQVLCEKIIDHPAFKDYAAASKLGPKMVLSTAFNSLDAEQTFQGLTAFIQTEGAIAMANGLRPEYLAEFLGDTRTKMSADDREFFNMFLWETRAGKALQENCPAGAFKLRLAGKL